MRTPWEDEADQWFGTRHGLPLVILRARPAGHLCGYVGIDKTHPLHGVHYGDHVQLLEPFMHRPRTSKTPNYLGIFCMALAEGPRYRPDTMIDVHGGITYAEDHVPEHEPDGRWWYGFDCSHAGDLRPFDDPSWRLGYETYRDMAYVRRETRKLADQLHEISAFVGDLDTVDGLPPLKAPTRAQNGPRGDATPKEALGGTGKGKARRASENR